MFVSAQSLANVLEVPDAFLDGFGYVTDAVFGGGAALFEGAASYIFPSGVEYLNQWVESHSFTFRKPLPLMSKPIQAIYCIFMYFGLMSLIYMFAKRAGKQQYRRLGLIHNAFLFSVSLYMGLGFLFTAMASFDRPWNNPILDPATDDNGWRMAKMFWVFTISKLAEYGDTYLMVLKHNHHQITFLHVYHHCSIFLWCYLATLVGCGGDVYWSAMVNSWVHVFMYGYYAGTLAFKDGPVRRMLNSIKFIITKGQITQFVLNMVQAFYVFAIADVFHYPRYMMVGQILYMSTMVALFANYLIKNQGKPPRASAAAAKQLPASNLTEQTTISSPDISISPKGRSLHVTPEVARHSPDLTPSLSPSNASIPKDKLSAGFMKPSMMDAPLEGRAPMPIKRR